MYDPVIAGYSFHNTRRCRGDQGRNEARWRPWQEASLALPCSNLKSLGTKCTVMKKVLVTLLLIIGALAVIWRPDID